MQLYSLRCPRFGESTTIKITPSETPDPDKLYTEGEVKIGKDTYEYFAHLDDPDNKKKAQHYVVSFERLTDREEVPHALVDLPLQKKLRVDVTGMITLNKKEHPKFIRAAMQIAKKSGFSTYWKNTQSLKN